MPGFSICRDIVTITLLLFKHMLLCQNSSPLNLYIQVLNYRFIMFKHELEHENSESWYTFNKLFVLTTMTSELSKCLNEQLGVLAKMKLVKNIKKRIFQEKLFCIMQYFIKYFCYLNFSRSRTFSFNRHKYVKKILKYHIQV